MRFGREDSRPFDSNLDSSTAPGPDSKGAGTGHADKVPWTKSLDGHVEHGQVRVVGNGRGGREDWEEGTDLNDETGIGQYPM